MYGKRKYGLSSHFTLCYKKTEKDIHAMKISVPNINI